jgi:hypothetical protein
MSDPELEPLDPELAALLDAAREPPAIPSGARERVLGRAEQSLGFGGPGGGGASAPPRNGPGGNGGGAASAAGLAGRPLATAIGALLLGAAGGAGAVVAFRPAPPPLIITVPVLVAGSARPSIEQAPTGVPAEARPPIAPALPIAPARPPLASSAAGEAAGKDVDLAAERAVLEIARNAVGRGEGAAALRALERHAAEFPRGRLTEEREALWIQALALAGRRSEARARAERFRASFPRSMLRQAIAAMLDDDRRDGGPQAPKPETPNTPPTAAEDQR